MRIILIVSEVEYIPKEIKKFIGNKNITTNIYRVLAYDSIMCEYFCIVFIDFMMHNERPTDFTKLFFSKQLWER